MEQDTPISLAVLSIVWTAMRALAMSVVLLTSYIMVIAAIHYVLPVRLIPQTLVLHQTTPTQIMETTNITLHVPKVTSQTPLEQLIFVMTVELMQLWPIVWIVYPKLNASSVSVPTQ